MTDLLLNHEAHGVASVTLNRAKQHNAFDDALIATLTQTLRTLDADANVRIVVLRANGKSFCAGADLNWMKRMAGYSESENLADAKGLAELMRTLDRMSKPTIARVHGAAYGGGVGLVACCDIAVGYSDATFCFSEARLGLVPAVISPYVIAAIGARYARRYFLSAEVFSAAEAYRIGLLHDLVSDEAELDEMIDSIIERLLDCGPSAQTQCKHLIADVANRSIDIELIGETAARIAQLRASAEGRDGTSAFLEKRKPRWMR